MIKLKDILSGNVRGVQSLHEAGMPAFFLEGGRESEYWWMDKHGELTPVGHEQHSPVGRQILKQKHNIDVPYPYNVFEQMFKLGYIRVGFAGMMGEYYIEINHGQGFPNLKQWKSLKDLAIEMGAVEISDDTNGKRIRVDEGRLLTENFHENKEWFIYEGENSITAVFKDNTRKTFKLNLRGTRGEDRIKHRHKAAQKWKRIASDIKKESTGLNEVGNETTKPWKECFEEALKDIQMKEFVDDGSYTPIFENINGKPLHEMTYDELRQSMKNYRIRKGGGGQTAKVGDNGREERSKHVRVKPLRVVSTVGKDGQERETSLFSYNTAAAWRTGGAFGHGHQGYIRFVEGYEQGMDGDVEVNCNCEDYKYVWAKANKDAGAGPVHADGDIKVSGFRGGANDNNGTDGKGIRNPGRVQGLCKHLLAVADYLDINAGPVVKAKSDDPDQPSPVSKKPVAKPNKPEKPVNIFENIKNFALRNPQFIINYED